MGKIADDPVTMTTKVHAPTSEQLRIAQLLGDKLEDNAIMREKCQKVVETTGCSETMALIALHDCNNCIEDAVIKILDGTPEQGEWTVQEGRKAKKQQVGYSLKDNATPSSEDINDDFDDINNKAFRRSAAGGGVNHRSRSGGPPRLRGRGGGPGSRGQGPRRRMGGNENTEATANVNFDEHSSELSRKPGRPRGERGRGRGGGARGGSYAGAGTGMGRRHVAEQPFDGGMSTWTNEAESNTWDNSMANNKWANNNNNHQQQPQPQMDEWKGGNVAANSNNSKHVDPSTNNSNTWDNSMAQNVINPNKAMVAQPSANHIDEWTPDDWGGEEDWTSMKGRVFTSSTNMVQQQQQSMKSNSSVQPPSSNSTFSSKVADVGRTSDPTGIPSHLRGESIDVKSLFGQKPNGDVNINDVSSTSASWSKQATDTLKNELGIGKVVSPNIEQSNQVITRDTRPFGKPAAAAKVEMPNSGPGGMSGLIDVEFGEFPTKLRNDDTSALFEYGSTTFNSSDLTALPAQSTKDQSGKNISMVYHSGASVKKDSSQLNGNDMLLSTVGSGGQSSVKDTNVIINQSKQTNDMLSSSYPNAANTYISSQDHQSQFPSRSSSLLVNNNQQQKASSGLPPGLQTVNQSQRSYLTNNSGIQSSAGLNESVVSPQLAKESNLGPSQATLQTGQNIASGLNFNPNATRTTTAVTTASKPQINPTLINPAAAANQFQSLPQMAAPYIYDQNYINALSILSPPGIFPFDISSLGQVPPLANNVAALRDVAGLGAGDVKQQYGRLDSGLSGANNTVNAPPGLGPATANNAEQAAQLITPAAAAIQYSLMNTMQAPFYPFILPTVTNSTASTVSSGNQYAKNSVFSPVYYPTTNDALQQMQLDYSKNVYASQSKQAATSNMSLNANDVNNKAYPPGLKNAFDNKSFQNTATPPPAIGNVGYPPTAIHSSSAYGAFPGYLPHMGMNIMPPNIAQSTSMTNDVISGGGQRQTSQVNKNNAAALYGQQKYWGGQN